MVELLRWQWQASPRYHGERANLLLHVVRVPVFVLGNVVLLVALARQPCAPGLVALVAMVISLALQGRGHRQEATSPEPFTSLGNAVARIFGEQWTNVSRFVRSGRRHRATRTAS